MRDYAQIFTAIWQDDDFVALTSFDQRLFFLLVSQPDITAAGTLALTPGRWGTLAPDTDRESITLGLKRLEFARFLVVDWDTDELLVRSFMKWDKGYTNPKRKFAIFDAARAILSKNLAGCVSRELARLGVTGFDVPPGAPTTAPPAGYVDPYPDPEDVSAGDCLSDSPSIGERFLVTVSGSLTDRETQDRKTSGSAKSATHPRARAIEEPPPDDDAPPGPSEAVVSEWLDTLRHRPLAQTVQAVGLFVQAALRNGMPVDAVRAGVAAWQAKRLGPGALPSFIHEYANEARTPAIPDQRRPASTGVDRHRPHVRVGTDERVVGWLELGRAAA